jgi:hypothetical protein
MTRVIVSRLIGPTRHLPNLHHLAWVCPRYLRNRGVHVSRLPIFRQFAATPPGQIAINVAESPALSPLFAYAMRESLLTEVHAAKRK